MRLEWLEDLLAVAETGSFHEAAERRFLTQSAFSRRIQNIEDHIGIELFDRTRKPVQLRPTMADKHDQIQRLAMELRQLVVDLRLDARVASNRIVLASQHSLTTTLTPYLVKRMRQQNEAIHARLRSANLDECFGLLLSRQADIAIVYRVPGEEHPVSAGYVESTIVGADRLIPVFDASAVPEMDAQMARDEIAYVAYPVDVFLGRVMGRLIMPRLSGAIRLIPVAETALTLAALEMATAGIGVAWVPESLAKDRIASGLVTDLSDVLHSAPLDIMAVRLSGMSGPVINAVWSEISAAGST
ncbi:LysR family transcriptional regulator [Shinella sumterensis]|uniref:LysR family transcriptional regulator n=1 Tax=Shinella sumterensis TaxID=1967501 RepID=A0AA50CRQ1_9HYPH|nr:LysR family transcriptional regulator [Shinella sumterensis]WLS00824.1 LysR family transcriptional regulator [Shinella sumterensis]